MIYNDFCGNKISRLGFGAMRFPSEFSAVKALIDKAMASGINYYDTAYVYENSEVLLGRALKNYPRDKFYVTSKMPSWLVKDESDLERIFNETLNRLGVDYIDYYLIHSVSDAKEIKNKNVYPFLMQKKKEGKIRHLGFSIHAKVEVLEEMLEIGEFDFAQIQLNYLDIIHEPGLAGYEILTKHNIPVVIMEPLKGGTLAQMNDEIAKPFKELGNKSNASYAFRWLMQYPNIKVILSGMTYIPQLEDNLSTFNEYIPLNEKEEKAIKEVKDNILKIQKVPCTGCRYCMPCPAGVNIPGNFKVWNTISFKKATTNHNWISDTSVDPSSGPLKCVKCGKCMLHCPQKIQIPTMLEAMAKELNLKKE